MFVLQGFLEIPIIQLSFPQWTLKYIDDDSSQIYVDINLNSKSGYKSSVDRLVFKLFQTIIGGSTQILIGSSQNIHEHFSYKLIWFP